MLRLSITLAFLVLLGGCSTQIMSKKECLAGDWYAAGLEDGGLGRLESAYNERVAQCAQYGAAAADTSAYVEGRELALLSLCTDGGGYAFAREGGVYRGVCRPETERNFLNGYISGRRIYIAIRAQASAQSAYNSAVSSVDHHRNGIRYARRTLRAEDSTQEEIEKARESLDYHLGAINYAENRADAALYDLGRADEALDDTIGSIDQWRESGDFWQRRQALAEAHMFAREDAAIDHCTDEIQSTRPICVIRAAAEIKERSGAVCATGPGEARFVGRESVPQENGTTGALHRYDFHPYREGTQRPQRRPYDSFFAAFEGEETITYSGAACPRLYPAE